MTAPSHTAANPVADNRECASCRMTLSANELSPEVLELWEQTHGGHDA